MAKRLTSKGRTRTVQTPASRQAQRELLKLRGKVKFATSVKELRYDRK